MPFPGVTPSAATETIAAVPFVVEVVQPVAVEVLVPDVVPVVQVGCQ